jgi:multiple sugar transport system permease protein
MKTRVFLAFVTPSLAMMAIFIAFPLVSVLLQSFQNTQTLFHEARIESCTPGFPSPVCRSELKQVPELGTDGRPQTRTAFVGLENYQALTRSSEVAAAFSPGGIGLRVFDGIDFFRALRFTLTFTLVTLPLVLGMGLALALALNSVSRLVRGPVIFVSLLPFIITPVIGALSVRWLFESDGILTAALQSIFGGQISLLSHDWSLQLLMILFKVWHTSPFAFLIFYAGLQGLSTDTMDAATVDGASRWQRLRAVVLPHLMPLIVFVALIHLMDSYRVFDEVVGFASQARVISLQWLTFDLLTPDSAGNRAIGRASASSMLTMVGIVILLVPLILRTWREHRRG